VISEPLPMTYSDFEPSPDDPVPPDSGEYADWDPPPRLSELGPQFDLPPAPPPVASPAPAESYAPPQSRPPAESYQEQTPPGTGYRAAPTQAPPGRPAQTDAPPPPRSRRARKAQPPPSVDDDASVAGPPGPPAPPVTPAPPPGDGGYISGRAASVIDGPLKNVIYWFVLFAAAVVDVVNFQTVIAIVMRDSSQYLTWTVVGGFTVLALALAHRVGQLARDRADLRHPPLTSGTAWLALLGWLAMGLFAFYVRYEGNAGGSVLRQLAGAGNNIETASLFLTFYVATGLIAGLAGYHRPHPDGARYRAAEKRIGRLTLELGDVQGQLAEVTSMLETNARNRREEKAELAAAEKRAGQLIAQLKVDAEFEIRSRVVRRPPPAYDPRVAYQPAPGPRPNGGPPQSYPGTHAPASPVSSVDGQQPPSGWVDETELYAPGGPRDPDVP
jgi:hypothetical protein